MVNIIAEMSFAVTIRHGMGEIRELGSPYSMGSSDLMDRFPQDLSPADLAAVLPLSQVEMRSLDQRLVKGSATTMPQEITRMPEVRLPPVLECQHQNSAQVMRDLQSVAQLMPRLCWVQPEANIAIAAADLSASTLAVPGGGTPDKMAERAKDILQNTVPMRSLDPKASRLRQAVTATVPEPDLVQNIQDPRLVTLLRLGKERVHMVEEPAVNRMARAVWVLQPDDLLGRDSRGKSVGDHRAEDRTARRLAAAVTNSGSKVCRKY